MDPVPSPYQRQIAAQIAQYADVADMHEAAPVAHWVRERFEAENRRAIFGTGGVVEFYAEYVGQAVRRSGIDEVVSIGSGNGALEIDIVKWARDHALPAFRITCLELSPVLVGQTRAAASVAGLEQSIRPVEADLNQPLPLRHPVAAFMAHHSLHHLVEIEQLFDGIIEWLHPEGAFVSADMIGRNGHMRWPETLAVIREIWPKLPDRLKRDHMFQRLDRWYENWDCSIEGFEGIRAQDILPALLHRKFGFERFFATGGLMDVFYEKRFGRNFDLDNPLDIRFLEQLHGLEQHLLATGQIKPVGMFAVMRSPRSTSCPLQPICVDGMTPENAVRPVGQATLRSLPRRLEAALTVPYAPVLPPPLPVISRGKPVSFGLRGSGLALLRWGWADPEDDFTWSVGIESALQFSVAETTQTFDLRFIAYRSPGNEPSTLRIMVNGIQHADVDLSGETLERHRFGLPEPMRPGSAVLLELAVSRPRRPDLDGGDDRRPIGLALIALTTG